MKKNYYSPSVETLTVCTSYGICQQVSYTLDLGTPISAGDPDDGR